MSAVSFEGDSAAVRHFDGVYPAILHFDSAQCDNGGAQCDSGEADQAGFSCYSEPDNCHPERSRRIDSSLSVSSFSGISPRFKRYPAIGFRSDFGGKASISSRCQHARAFTYIYVKQHPAMEAPKRPAPHDLSASQSEAARSVTIAIVSVVPEKDASGART
ncbi:MAG TPA: hypothetical protein DHV29_09600 [Bacteroidales bacterium]|nr:MAG: hypothetical protein A2W94_07485 [Bacteroidetes bacterium GWE2_42_42]HCB62611.1 hypothetical protein [Bacteroidales bacterium]HCY23731.1 hypothetical protein [Bacteroidales bacterium]